MSRPECEQHHTPARDNQYRATARYYKDSCPYCEIERLKVLIREQAHTIERMVSEAYETPELLSQLAEARAEVKALTDCLNGSRKATYTAEMYDKGVAEARREGWEQGKKQADSLLLDLVDVVLESKPVVQSARRAIAAMEYGESK